MLRTLRREDQRNGILVVTEGLYSMDADSPDLERLRTCATSTRRHFSWT
ncbi:hypothetical protein [Streptomyces cinereoruber]